MDPIALADLCNNVCMPIRYFAEWIMNNYDLVIENAAILTMDDNEPFIKNGIIGVKNGTITLVKKRHQMSAAKPESVSMHGA